ncbi:MAG TPA: hypothetical protein VHS33_00350 [Sphingomicrobium sp.]|jgi:hypothetical protein|nr:hypothetical protein [Sphingomicrobium sp.]
MLLGLLLAAQAAAPADLSAFKPFVGACWRASFSATVNDTHCFEAMYGGAHVRDRHEVKEGGRTVYAGETIYSADGPDLVFTYVNSLGGVGSGKVAASNAVLGFTGSMRASPDKAQEPIDTEWRIIDSDHYEVRTPAAPKDSQPEKPLVFSRVTEAKPR